MAQAARAVSRRPPAASAPAARAQLTVAPAPVVVPRARFVVLVLLVVVLGVLGILLLNTRINENAFRLYELRQEQAALDRRQQELEERIAEANSTAQLSAAARELGLVRVSGDQLGRIRLPSGEVVGEPVPVTEDEPGTGDEPDVGEEPAQEEPGTGEEPAPEQPAQGEPAQDEEG